MSDYTGYEEQIDWNAVSGIDLATKPRLLARWTNSATRRNEERRIRSAARRSKAAPELACFPAEITSVNPFNQP